MSSEFNKIMPVTGPVPAEIMSSRMKTIEVMPSSKTVIIQKSSEKKPNVKFLGIDIGRTKTGLETRNSFVSKLVRYAKADEYTTIDTTWSKVMIGCSVITGIMTLIIFIVSIYLYFSEEEYSSVYILDSALTDELKEKNKPLDTLNTMSKVATGISISLGAVSLVAAYKHWRAVFDINDFKPGQKYSVETQPK